MNIQSSITGEQTPRARYGHPPDDARIAVEDFLLGANDQLVVS